MLGFGVAQAQMSDNHGYSFGFRAFSLSQMPKILNQTNSQDYVRKYVDKFVVKYNDNQINYRISGNYFSENITFKNQCETCEEANGKRSDYGFKLGFEKNLNYSVVQPYFGFDLGYRSNNFNGTVRSIQPGSATVPYNVEMSKTGVTFTPILGTKFNVAKQVSAFIEGNLDFYLAYERRETTDQIVGSPTSFNRFTRMEYLLNPVSVGLQVNF